MYVGGKDGREQGLLPFLESEWSESKIAHGNSQSYNGQNVCVVFHKQASRHSLLLEADRFPQALSIFQYERIVREGRILCLIPLRAAVSSAKKTALDFALYILLQRKPSSKTSSDVMVF